MQIEMTLGMCINAIRKMKGLSQTELARRVGCSRNEISLIERDLANARLSTIIAVAEAMDYTLDIRLLDKQGRRDDEHK